jgi:hypothetical protein
LAVEAALAAAVVARLSVKIEAAVVVAVAAAAAMAVGMGSVTAWGSEAVLLGSAVKEAVEGSEALGDLVAVLAALVVEAVG